MDYTITTTKDNKNKNIIFKSKENVTINNNNNNNEQNKIIEKQPHQQQQLYKFKPPIKDYSKYFSLRNTTPCTLTEIEISSFSVSNEIYSYGAGVPSKLFFPIKELGFKFNFIEDQYIDTSKLELETIQQYSDIGGFPKLLDWVRELQMRYHGLDKHDKAGKEWDCFMTPGSQHALDSCFKVFFDRNDSLLVERYTYGGMFALAVPAGVNTVPVELDGRGIVPEDLRRVLENWYTSPLTANMKYPKALYLIPHGQNPTGIIYDMARKLEIYKLACEFDFLIIEDDPHFFLQLDNEKDSKGRRQLVPSFLRIDAENRVIRLDTFSKFLSSGIRMGWVTTNKRLYNSIGFELNASVFHSSSLPQIMLEKLLLAWGMDGFDKHIDRVQNILVRKRKETKELLDKHLLGQVEYLIPNSGLYFWVKLLGVDCSYSFVSDILIHNKVLFGLGISHSPDRSIKCPYVRITFSYLDKEDGDVAFKILSNCLKHYLTQKNNHKLLNQQIHSLIKKQQ